MSDKSKTPKGARKKPLALRTFRASDAEWQAVHAAARRDGIPVSEAIRRALRRYVEES